MSYCIKRYFNIVSITLLTAITSLVLISCRPAEPNFFPQDNFLEADSVYYSDLIIFIGGADSAKSVIVCDFGREKAGENYTGEFWGCIYRDGNWEKLSRSGEYRLLSSRPSIPEGPPGVSVKTHNGKFQIEYSDENYNFSLKTDAISNIYKSFDSDNTKEYYGDANAEIIIGDTKIKGTIFYAYFRWVNYQPITTKYKKRYTDFRRFFLIGDNIFIVAKENKADISEFAAKYDLPDPPETICASIKRGNYNKTFDNFKSITTNWSYDLAFFRIPFGWEVEFDDNNSLSLSGDNYYLDNKLFTGRGIVNVSGTLKSEGKSYPINGVCEFIK